MNRGLTGTYVSSSATPEEVVNAFVPAPLPPEPKIEWIPDLARRHERAIAAVGRLDGVLPLLPDATLFLYSYIRKEAIVSSQIEGTQSTLLDLFEFEAGHSLATQFDDLKEVSNYVAAMEHGIRRIREGFPISTRLIREIHGILLASGRGSMKNPGELRRSQNWIGGTRPGNALFVPPPPDRLAECMSGLEKFIHDDPAWTSTLVKAALAHLQFESIHPFEDGNGRVGRLLISLILCAEDLLHEPLLYLSLYFKEHREEYYALLQRVRTDGDWESWLCFFFDGVEATSNEAAAVAQGLLRLFATDRDKILELGRHGATAQQVHFEFQRFPVRAPGQITEQTKLSPATVNKAIGKLVELGILVETTGKKRNRLFAYREYLDRISRGTAPIT